MEKFRSVHLGHTERKNPNLCPSTGALTLELSTVSVVDSGMSCLDQDQMFTELVTKIFQIAYYE